jgi:hypothetical protein
MGDADAKMWDNCRREPRQTQAGLRGCYNLWRCEKRVTRRKNRLGSCSIRQNVRVMRHIQFFAVKQDILRVLQAVESDGSLQYVRTGNRLSPDFEKFLCGADIPGLGIADQETGGVCKSFLVTKTTVPITVRELKGDSGIQRYLMDQLLNPDTVTLTPAGLWSEDILLQGVVGTASDSAVSQGLMKKFNSGFKKSFTKVQWSFVGSEALVLLKAGKRLTDAAQSPPEFDLNAKIC